MDRGCGLEQTGGVSDAFQTWVDGFDNALSADARALLRQIFDEHGTVSREEVARLGLEHQIGLARVAVRLLGQDLAATTDLEPPPFRYTEEDCSVRIACWGHFATNPIMGLDQAAVTVEVADFIQGEAMEDLHAPWPTCPEHHAGVHPVRTADRAGWACGADNHQLAVIGTLLADKRER